MYIIQIAIKLANTWPNCLPQLDTGWKPFVMLEPIIALLLMPGECGTLQARTEVVL